MSEPQLSLDDRIKEAQIEKLKAEAAAAQNKPNAWQATWVPLTAAVLAGFSGFAALLTAGAQIVTANQTLAKRTAVVEADERVNQAEARLLKADRQTLEINKEVQRRTKEYQDRVGALQRQADASTRKAAEVMQQAQIQAEQKRQELAALEQQVKDKQAFVDQLKRVADAQQTAVLAAKADLGNSRRPASVTAVPGDRTRSVAASLAAAPGRLVYLQYQDVATAAALKGVQTQLTKSGYVAPGIEHLDAKYFKGVTGEVRYFRGEDKGEAERIAGVANQYFAARCSGAPPVKARNVAAGKPYTRLELWVGFSCREKVAAR